MRAYTIMGQNFSSLECGSCQDLIHVEISRKKNVVPIE